MENIIERLERRLETLETEQYVIFGNVIGRFGGSINILSKNIDSLKFSNSVHVEFVLCELKKSIVLNNNGKNWLYRLIDDKFLMSSIQLNIKKIILENNSCHGIDLFLDYYLKYKKDFIVDEIIINDLTYHFIPTIIKYTNYKKLVIPYDKTFNDRDIKAHCDNNGIIFDYIT
jgi:hypothetical protein